MHFGGSDLGQCAREERKGKVYYYQSGDQERDMFLFLFLFHLRSAGAPKRPKQTGAPNNSMPLTLSLLQPSVAAAVQPSDVKMADLSRGLLSLLSTVLDCNLSNLQNAHSCLGCCLPQLHSFCSSRTSQKQLIFDVDFCPWPCLYKLWGGRI